MEKVKAKMIKGVLEEIEGCEILIEDPFIRIYYDGLIVEFCEKDTNVFTMTGASQNYELDVRNPDDLFFIREFLTGE